MNKSVLCMVTMLLVVSSVHLSCGSGGVMSSVFAQDAGGDPDGDDDDKKDKKGGGKKGDKKDKSTGGATDGAIRILDRWDLPAELKEISGIALAGPDLFACVQDEAGEIFFYNTATRRLWKAVRFGEAGDYEGIAVVGSTAWVMRADGRLFEVKNFAGVTQEVTEHTTAFTTEQDVEGLCLDKKGNRLLLAVKGKDPMSKDYRGIYPFDLATKKLVMTPAYKIDAAGSKGKHSSVQPSDICLHPRTGELYILDGPSSGLLILGPDGRERAHYRFPKTDFPQPEGILITDAGDLYISNEGGKGVGTILKVALGAS